MTTTSVPIEIIQGQTFRMNVTWADATTDPATPLSLTGYRAHMQIRSKAGASGTPLVDLSSIGVNPQLAIEPNSATGVVGIRIGADVTATLTKNCAYDLFIIRLDDVTEAVRLVAGAVTINKSVSVNS